MTIRTDEHLPATGTAPSGGTSAHAGAGRLYFLDWVRIIAFFLLIVYHTGMYYVSWDWHVKSPHAGEAIEPFMMMSSPWRLGLLFLVSGAATAFLLRKSQQGGTAAPLSFVRLRSWRLLLPLIVGMFVVVPPQPYLEVVEKVAYAGSFADFMRLYVAGYGGFCREDCLVLPTWNHLWFVAYLWTYSMLLWLGLRLAGDRAEGAAARLAGWLRGWRALLLPALALGGVRVALVARFPSTHDLVNDWYNHAQYLPLFAAGFLLARQPAFWRTAEALRWPALATAIGCWAAWVAYVFAFSEFHPPPDALRMAVRVGYGFLQWGAMLAACGFARRHLDRDGPARRYLVPAVFPVYIFHQTIIVVLAHHLKPAGMPPVAEGIVLVAATFVLCFALYGVVKRVAWLRPLFGLGPLLR